MNKLKKIFGEINITWPKLVIFAIIIGIYTGIMAMVPQVKDTSFSDLTATFEVWILFGVLIIVNTKSAKESALKCFVFFLISQPLIYLVQDVVNHSNLFFTYYRYWFIWTIATILMGFIGYNMKKDKWWGLIILAPILLLLGYQYNLYLRELVFEFPRHLLTTIFCFVTLIIYPIAIFKNKKIRIAGTVISGIIIIVATVFAIINPLIYNTTILVNGEKNQFDDTYKVYLPDENYGKVFIVYEKNIEDYMVNAEFKKAGKTEVILESPTGEKRIYDIDIKLFTYDINRK